MRNSKHPTPKGKQIAALLGVVILVLMYVSVLLAALFGNPNTDRFFFMALYATMILPILIWVYSWLYQKFTATSAPADTELPDHETPIADNSDSACSLDRK